MKAQINKQNNKIQEIINWNKKINQHRRAVSAHCTITITFLFIFVGFMIDVTHGKETSELPSLELNLDIDTNMSKN